MRIISNIKDYYDSLQTFEDYIIYERKFEICKDQKINNMISWEKRLEDIWHFKSSTTTLEQTKFGSFNDRKSLQPFLFGFCGKWIKMYFECDYDYYGEYCVKELHDFLESKEKKKLIHPGEELEKKFMYRYPLGDLGSYSEFNLDFLDKENLFHKFKTPILGFTVYREKFDPEYKLKIWKDFPLTKVNFQKTMNVYSVFQELEMFIGGVIGTKEKSTDHLEDKHRMGSRFDKWSFRRPPEKK